MIEADMARAVSDGEARSGDEVHAFRQAVNMHGRNADLFAVGAVIHHRHHPLADLKAFDAGSERVDTAGAFEAGAEGETGPRLVLAGRHKGVREVHADRRRAHPHFAGAGFVRGDILDGDRVDPVEGPAKHRAHQRSTRPSIASERALASSFMAVTSVTAPSRAKAWSVSGYV